jgi:RNase H-like domain found in reverse transcriptase/Integrase zinc binding domain
MNTGFIEQLRYIPRGNVRTNDGPRICTNVHRDLLVITNGTFEDHLEKLDKVLQRLGDVGLQVNARKSFFARYELEYLGFWITREGINVKTPTTRKELRSFIRMINYYKDMWIRRSDVLAPLSTMCGKTTKREWTDVHQKAFETIKRIMSQEVLLTYPDFSKTFDIHTDASKLQMGAVISQEGKPIAFFSKKLNDAQTRYTTTERELLAIVETLKEFKNILIGQRIRVYTDHKNLIYKDFNTERVLRWRLSIEEFGPEILYVKGINNPVADALSRLDIASNDMEDTFPPETLEQAQHDTILMLKLSGLHIQSIEPKDQRAREAFGLQFDDEDLPEHALPVTYAYISKCQKADQALEREAKTNKAIVAKPFQAAGQQFELLCFKGRIMIPKRLQRRIVTWYHEQLCHPGETRTESTIAQHYYWRNLRNDVRDVCSRCPTCQKNKKPTQKLGLLPAKDDPAEYTPWDKLCVDLIGPYTIKIRPKKELTLWCVTMIDPATGWVEIREIPTKRADVVANIVDAAWFTRYPLPTVITFDRGSEFMAEFAQMVTVNYGIKKRGITTRNPQANAIIERMHQTLGNMIRTFPKDAFELEDPWTGILAATMFALRATVHTTLKATPTQLVFGRDAILNSTYVPDWDAIKQQKQQKILENNRRENAKRKDYTYKVNDQVLHLDAQKYKYGRDVYNGPYKILQVFNNGTVRLQLQHYADVVNIRQIKPYKI